MIRFVRFLAALLLALLMGCANFNAWFDKGVTPPQDTKWTLVGAGFDGALHVAKVPFVWRVAADITAASVVRLTPAFHKPLDSGFDLAFGASVWEIGARFRKILRGLP